MTDEPDAAPRLVLGDISTSWRRLHDPLRFVMTYGPAVRAYLLALLRDEHEADEALQDLLVRVTEYGFPNADPVKGQFRDYLKVIVRNAARKRQRPRPTRQPADGELEQAAEGAADAGERAWREQWRQCVLDGAWRALERHQRAAGGGNLSHTVLRLTADHPEADGRDLAARAAVLSGQRLTPEAFRKQVSRARRTFAELIAAEVRQTLDGGTSEQVRDELADLGLLEFVRPYLADE